MRKIFPVCCASATARKANEKVKKDPTDFV